MTQPQLFSRRTLILTASAALAVGGYGAWRYTHPEPVEGTASLSVQEAYAAAQAGEILLVDIRRPDEWSRTGLPEGAVPLDMRRADFIDALDDLTKADNTRPVALICARGVRSARLTSVLSQAGYTNLIDVPEGMLGSRAGPGWLAAGLPVEMAP